MVNYVKMTVLFQLINCKDYFLYNLQSNCRKDEGECSEFSKKKKKKIKCRYCCTYYEDSAVDPYSFTKRKNLKVKVGDYSENKLKRIN